MISVRRAEDRGSTKVGWLDSRHTFSFNRYHDPEWMGFGVLRVINDDRVVPGAGFPSHSHRDMEILTWVLDGTIAHRDSTGAGEVLGVGEIQRMTAGRGITHSELNPNRDQPLHFLQIWIVPERAGLEPGYEQLAFAPEALENRLRRVAAPGGGDGAVHVHQDCELWVARLDAGHSVEHELRAGRRAWLQVALGEVSVNGERLAAGDGIALENEPRVAVSASARSEILLFDLP